MFTCQNLEKGHVGGFLLDSRFIDHLSNVLTAFRE